jgi:hypothetical protein
VDKVTHIDLATVRALEKLTVEVRVSGGLRRGDFVRTLRRRAVAKLNDLAASYAVDLTAEDIVYSVLPGKPDVFGCNNYRCRWEPTGLAVELSGGPKDGQEIQLSSPRQHIRFQVLSPAWREVMAAPDAPPVAPKVNYVYEIVGYNLASRRWVFALTEER